MSAPSKKSPKLPDTQIAVQLYTLRDFLKTPADIDRTFARVREIGYKAVQVSGLGPIEPQALRDLLEKHKLYCCAWHHGWKDLTETAEATIHQMTTAGCNFTALGYAPHEFHSLEGVIKLAGGFNEVVKKFKKSGITVGYHNHKFEFQKMGKKTWMQELVERTKKGGMAVELDTYWVQYGGGDVAAWIRSVKGRMPVAHLKDFTVRQMPYKATENGQEVEKLREEVVMCEVGEGNLNWPAIFKALKEVKTRWYCVEQDAHWTGGDPFKAVEISYKNLRKMKVA
ncbi:MAG: sugar phosphate isomerase/epimerase [Spirochaetes bacterium]|nr:sugar phosphate isomerase/epimerase [Spirochaetota bacterium]